MDPSSGDLAVTNLQNFSGAGIVLLYKHARGTPGVYSNKEIAYYYFAGYDGSGDLYVSGQTSQHRFALGALARGAKSISGVAISGGTIYFPGNRGLEWLKARARRPAVQEFPRALVSTG